MKAKSWFDWLLWAICSRLPKMSRFFTPPCRHALCHPSWVSSPTLTLDSATWKWFFWVNGISGDVILKRTFCQCHKKDIPRLACQYQEAEEGHGQVALVIPAKAILHQLTINTSKQECKFRGNQKNPSANSRQDDENHLDDHSSAWATKPNCFYAPGVLWFLVRGILAIDNIQAM